jgi:hypothetical protein
MGAKALNRVKNASVGLLVPVDSERLRRRYQVLMRMIKSAIEIARYAVDNENMKTMTPNKIFWLEVRKPLRLYTGQIGPEGNKITYIIIYIEVGISDA